MSTSERRKQPRAKVHYPISFVCTDEKDYMVGQNMGMALNLS